MNTSSSNTGNSSSNGSTPNTTPSTGTPNWSFDASVDSPSSPSPSSPDIDVVHSGSPSSSSSVGSIGSALSSTPSPTDPTYAPFPGCPTSKLKVIHSGLTGSTAIEAMKQGELVTRMSWPGDKYCWIKPATIIQDSWCRDQRLAEAVSNFGFETPVSSDPEEGTCQGIVAYSSFCQKTEENCIITWTPTPDDLVCDDWCVCTIKE
jgi:hypothetical protein